MPRGIYKRKKKVGRPRHAKGEDVGAKTTTFVFSNDEGWKPQKFTGMQTVDLQSTEPPTFLSRLEAATVKYEQAINDAITALKGQ